MRKLISSFSVVTLIVAAGVMAPAASFAQTTTTSSSVQTQLDFIASLTAQIQALQQQIQALQQQQQTATVSLVNSLSLGSQGDQVKVLQALLAANPSIYPQGLITGYYGALTEQAVKRYQQQNGIDPIGIVGPQTRAKLNAEMENNPISFENASGTPSGSTSTSTFSVNGGEGENQDQNQSNDQNGNGGGEYRRICAIVPPGHLIAPGWLRKGEGESETPIIPPCQTLPPGIVNQLPTSTTPTTTVTLAISGAAASVTTSTATVSWTTNVQANSQVMYGMTSAYGSSTELDSALETSHVETITGLAASTTYHFQAVSVNASGTATSSDMTFTTNALPAVVTLPVVSAVTSSAASTTASVSWITNVPATSKVYYGTANPLDITSTSTASVSTSTLVTSHTLALSGLAASTTYYFVVQSADASANTATSSQMSFVTAQ